MKEIYNNIPTTIEPHTWFDVSLYYKEEEIAIFQFIKLTEAGESNEFYLQRGLIKDKYVEHISYINEKNVYSIKINSPEFKKELQGVTLKAVSNGIMPGRRVIINAMSGTYEKLVDL